MNLSDVEIYGDEGDESDGWRPEEGDYTLTPCGPLGSRIAVGQVGLSFLADFAHEDDAVYFIRERMQRERFWPNVWNVSDHGNWTLNEG